MTWTVKIKDTTPGEELEVDLSSDHPRVEESIDKDVKLARQRNNRKTTPIAHDVYTPVHKFTIVGELRNKVDGKTAYQRKQDLMTLAKRGQRNLTFSWGPAGDEESWTVKITNVRITQMPGHGATFDSVVINLVEVDPDKSK